MYNLHYTISKTSLIIGLFKDFLLPDTGTCS